MATATEGLLSTNTIAHTMHVLETESLHVTASILSMLRSGTSLCTPQDLLEVLFTEEAIRERTRSEAFEQLIARGAQQVFEIDVLEQQLAALKSELQRVQTDRRYADMAEIADYRQEYDLVIDIPSLREVMREGWAVDINSNGKDISGDSADSDQEGAQHSCDSAVVAVVGLYNKGKTFLLNKLSNGDLPSSHTSPTKGLSFKRVQIDNSTGLTLMDTAGSFKPVRIKDERSISEQEMTELFLLDLVLDLSDYFICVVNDWTFLDQRYLDKVAHYLASSQNRAFKEIIVVHNLKEVTSAEALQDSWSREVAQIVGKIQRTQVAAVNPTTGKVETKTVSWAQTPQCRHLCMVNDHCVLGQQLNPWTISLLKYWLKGIVIPVTRCSSILSCTLPIMSQKLSVFFRQKVDLEVITNEGERMTIKGSLSQAGGEQKRKEVLLAASALTNIDPESFCPTMDIIRGEDTFVVYLNVPGFTESDLSLTRQNTTTIIQGRKPRSPVRGKWVKKERRSGDFAVSIVVPTEFERKWQMAELKDGVLCIVYRRDDGK